MPGFLLDRLHCRGPLQMACPRSSLFSPRIAPQLPRPRRPYRGIKAQASAVDGTAAAGSVGAEEESRAGDQVSQVAAILGQHVEALTAINAEILKTALIGSTTGPSQSALQSSSTAQSPESMLEAVHDSVLAIQRDSLHLMGEAEKEAWGRASWDVYHVIQAHLQRLLFGLHALAADMGSSTGAMQAADCLANGVLVPRDAHAAFKWYTRASSMGSVAASLKCGVHYFNGEPPTGQDPAKAYEYFIQALEQVVAAIKSHSKQMQQKDAAFDTLTAVERDAAVVTDRLYLEALQEQRSSALTWLGRCYLEGFGVPRDVAKAAELFRAAGNKDELRELAMLKQQFALVDLSDIEPRPAEG